MVWEWVGEKELEDYSLGFGYWVGISVLYMVFINNFIYAFWDDGIVSGCYLL